MSTNKISIVRFPYILNGSLLEHCLTSSLRLEVTRNLILGVGGVVEPLFEVYGKINPEQRKMLDNGVIFEGSYVRCNPLDYHDVAWAYQHHLSIYSKVEMGMSIFDRDMGQLLVPTDPNTAMEVTTSTAVEPPTPAQVEFRRVLEVMFKYHTDMFPDMNTSEYLEALVSTIRQYQSLSN